MKLVEVTDLTTHVDDRGNLTELLRTDDDDFTVFGQVYMVKSRSKGTIRAFHKHEEMWDWFTIIKGSAKFRFYDDGKDSQEVILTGDKLQRIAVPPGIYHGWMALEDDTILMSTGSELYMGENHDGELDEERIPWDSFDGAEQWEVKNK